MKKTALKIILPILILVLVIATSCSLTEKVKAGNTDISVTAEEITAYSETESKAGNSDSFCDLTETDSIDTSVIQTSRTVPCSEIEPPISAAVTSEQPETYVNDTFEANESVPYEAEKQSSSESHNSEPFDSASTPETECDHVIEVDPAVEPLCSKEGKTEGSHCSKCGCVFVEQKPVPTVDHDYVCTSETAPTCQAKGKITYKCSKCGKTISESVAKISHNFEYTDTVESTTSSEGYDLYTCSMCGLTEKRNVVPILKYSGAILTDKCSMVDYTKSAMPGESNKNYINSLLAQIDSNSPTYFEVDRLENQEDYDKRFSAHVMSGWHQCVQYEYISGVLNARTVYDAENNFEVKTVLNWINSVVSELKISKKTLQKDAIKQFNDYLCKYLKYDYDLEILDDYGAITNHEGVCQSYAALFQLLCQRCGIECYYVSDEALNHAYNYIVFSDGERYYVDVTWNDAALTYNGVYYEGLEEYFAAGGVDETMWKYREEYLFLPYDEFIEKHKH